MSQASGTSTLQPPTQTTVPRLRSLDVFRGLTISLMLIVNNPAGWTPEKTFAPLLHATWNGCTPTDLVFPFFLFIVGVAMAYSLRRHLASGERPLSLHLSIARRAATLVALGIALNFFGHFAWQGLRLPGVLQRIGLCFAIVSLVVLHVPRALQPVLAAISLLGYWALLTFVPVPGTSLASHAVDSNWPRWLDLQLLTGHLYKGSLTDPEGLMSTIPACVTTYIGYALGRWLLDNPVSRRPAQLALAGVGLLVAGWLWAGLPSLSLPDHWFETGAAWGEPLNKGLWSSSYVVFTAGLAILTLAACSVVMDRAKVTTSVTTGIASITGLPARLIEAIGRNAILVFVGSGMLARLLRMVPVPITATGPTAPTTQPLTSWFSNFMLTTFSSEPRLGSLLHALLHLSLWLAIAWWLDARKIYLRL